MTLVPMSIRVRTWWSACFAALALFALACNRETGTYHERLIVTAIFDPTATNQTIVVDKSFPVDSPAGAGGIRQAQVRYWRDGSPDTIFMQDSILSKPRAGFYRDTIRHAVLPYSSYRFRVDWRNPNTGREYSGGARVTVPGAFQISRPFGGETLALIIARNRAGETLAVYPIVPTFRWNPSYGAAGYVLTVRRHPLELDTVGFRIPLITTDTTLNPLPLLYGLFDGTGDYLLKAYAFDSLLYNQSGAPGTDLPQIGEDVYATYGAQYRDSVLVYFQLIDTVLP